MFWMSFDAKGLNMGERDQNEPSAGRQFAVTILAERPVVGAGPRRLAESLGNREV